MQCVSCGHDNPDTYRFCGSCGVGLRSPVPENVLATGASDQEDHLPAEHDRVVLSGPSLLGLNAELGSDSASYLLEDEPSSHSPAKKLLFLVLVLAAAAGFFAYRTFYRMPTFPGALTISPPVPGFAYNHTPAEVLTQARLSANLAEISQPSPKLIDNLRIENLSAAMRNSAAQEKLAAEQKARKPDPAEQFLAEGEKYLYGRGVATNCASAVKNFEAAAKEQNASAMAHLGSLYASGRCVKFNRVRAYEWFAKAKNADPDNHWLDASMDMLWRNMNQKERAAILD